MTSRFSPPLAVAYLAAALCCGCGQPGERDKLIAERDSALAQAKQLQQDHHRLSLDLAARDKQTQSLLRLGDKRLDLLYHVVRIDLSSHTGGVSTDDQPGDDAIRVFLLPTDQHGSVLKAAGSVTVQLYDLAEPEASNLIGECRYTVQDLAKQWYSGFLSYHYRFTCPFKTRPAHDEITVRAEFLDYLTGKAHTAQKLCKIALPAPATTRPAAP